MYERLKPVLVNLQVAYEYRGKEVEALRLQIIEMRMQSTVREENFENQITEERDNTKKSRWRGRIEGALAGALIGILF